MIAWVLVGLGVLGVLAAGVVLAVLRLGDWTDGIMEHYFDDY